MSKQKGIFDAEHMMLSTCIILQYICIFYIYFN